ncbi:MAG TPA: BTAD domain-containing putative transcriptional regulator [Mycobacterium sp.]
MAAEDALPTVLVEVLGPLRLVVAGAGVDVRGPKRRAVLALLALAEGRIVTVDRLLDALWPEEPPDSGRQALHTHVFRLRGHFGVAAARLQTRQDGYRLDLTAGDLDVTRARALLAAARANRQLDPVRALTLLREADALWRGPMLADLTEIDPIATAVEGYSRLHRDVTDALIACAIDAGQADEVVALASSSLTPDPLREPAVLLLMRALAATTQAREALRIGREYRHRLVEETGLDPSAALGELEHAIAAGTVGPPAVPRPSPGPERSAPRAARATAEPRRDALPQHGSHQRGTNPATSTGHDSRWRQSLIGREAQVAALHRLLAEQRLVTLVGPGGVGKSRVALEVAVPSPATTVLLLAPVTDPSAIPHALAAALNLTGVHGDVLAACIAVLGERPGLLVVDNCEHLLDAVRDTVDLLLAACPELTVLATSRERMGLAAEYVSRLSPLPLPGPGKGSGVTVLAVEQIPSVALFLDRAARVRGGQPPTPAELSLISDVVRRLDGMPLAIELAAGRLSSFSLVDLHRRLDRSLDLLGGGRTSGDARHRTLRATVEWSYELLTDDERRLFRHLSVFADGIALDDAERLAGELGLGSDPASILAHLVDASMIDADLAGGTRFRMLETLRAFGLDRLAAAGEDGAAADHFLRWAVDLTAWLGATLNSEHEPEADSVLRRELPNLRAAWRFARGRANLDDATSIVVGLFDAVAYRDLLEVRGWAEDLADDPALVGHQQAAAVLGTAAEAAYHRGDLARAELLARKGLDRATSNVDSWLCLSALSVVALARGLFAEAVEHSLAAAERAAGSRENLGIAALAKAYSGDFESARTLNDQGLVSAVSATMLSWGAYVAGEIETLAGRTDLAEEQYVRASDLARTSGATFLVGVATVGLLSVRVSGGRIREALTGYRDVIDYFARTGNWTHLWATLRNLADLFRRLGDDEPAGVLDAAADRAPDAPADNRSRTAQASNPGADLDQPIPGRAEILEIARRAIDRNLDRA